MTLTYGGESISLVEKKCIPCEGGVPPLANDEIEKLMKEIDENWKCLHAVSYTHLLAHET